MPEGISSPQQGQHPSMSAVPTSAATATATATSITHAVQQNETVTPSGDSSNVPHKPVSTSPYQSPGMTSVNSFGLTQPPSQPQLQASVANVSSGGTLLSTGQQYLQVSPPWPTHSSSPHDSYLLSNSIPSQQSSPSPSEQPLQAKVNVAPVAATAQHKQPPGVGHDQQQRDDSPKPCEYFSHKE